VKVFALDGYDAGIAPFSYSLTWRGFGSGTMPMA
jgi:hypothetical protein